MDNRELLKQIGITGCGENCRCVASFAGTLDPLQTLMLAHIGANQQPENASKFDKVEPDFGNGDPFAGLLATIAMSMMMGDRPSGGDGVEVRRERPFTDSADGGGVETKGEQQFADS